MNVLNLNDIEIDFNAIPITILSISDFEQDLQDIRESGLDDGIYYAMKLIDTNIEKDIKSQIISILNLCINEERRPPAGFNIPFIQVEDNVKHFFDYTAVEVEQLTAMGINPIRLSGNDVVVWGQSFILNNDPTLMLYRIKENQDMTCMAYLAEYACSIHAYKIKEKKLSSSYEIPVRQLPEQPLDRTRLELMCCCTIKALLNKDTSDVAFSRIEKAICKKAVGYVLEHPVCSILDLHNYCVNDRIDISIFYRNTRKPIWVLEEDVHINILRIFKILSSSFG
jgi:hypothetical protein